MRLWRQCVPLWSKLGFNSSTKTGGEKAFGCESRGNQSENNLAALRVTQQTRVGLSNWAAALAPAHCTGSDDFACQESHTANPLRFGKMLPTF
jgi:hypothetical protein